MRTKSRNARFAVPWIMEVLLHRQKKRKKLNSLVSRFLSAPIMFHLCSSWSRSNTNKQSSGKPMINQRSRCNCCFELKDLMISIDLTIEFNFIFNQELNSRLFR